MNMRCDRQLSLGSGAAAALAVLALNGCGLFGGETTPAPVDLTVTAAARLNPDDSGQSLPTVIRVYQLKATSRAEAAQFEDIYRRDKEVLGEDLLQVDEVVLSPGETARKTVASDKGARAVMVVGVFRKPSGNGWRIITELAKGKAAHLQFRAEDYRIERR
jgi:type VI secretion system protein VasD